VVLAVTLVIVVFVCIMYADDLLLLSPSLSGIQHMMAYAPSMQKCIVLHIMLKRLVVL